MTLATLRASPLIVALTLALLAAPPIAVAGPPAQKVSISNFAFGTMTLTVRAGTTVTWVNDDDVPHTVRAIDGAFHSKPLDTGDSFAFTFAKPGVYNYFCSIHPRMTAKVIVTVP